MQQPNLSPASILRNAWLNHNLIARLVQRKVVRRYRGSVVGIFGTFFNPLLILAVYTFAFSTVFQAQWQGVGELKVNMVIEQCRNVLFWGKGLEAGIYVVQLIVAAAAAWGGYVWFQITRKGFADVL